MTTVKSQRPVGIWIVSIIALVFGMLTIKSGGSVLFIDGPARVDAGNYVPFVLWFNFLAGFAYLLAGTGLFMQKHWAPLLSVLIAVATLLVFVFLGLHILNDGAYESRTIAAMSLRSFVWVAIAVFSYRKASLIS